MSRTIKSMPYGVVAKERGQIVEDHDHRFGPCDLTDATAANVGWTDHYRNHRCHWDYTTEFWYTQHCGCGMCTGRFERREERRASRHHAKIKARYIRKYGDYDTDIPVLPKNYWG